MKKFLILCLVMGGAWSLWEMSKKRPSTPTSLNPISTLSDPNTIPKPEDLLMGSLSTAARQKTAELHKTAEPNKAVVLQKTPQADQASSKNTMALAPEALSAILKVDNTVSKEQIRGNVHTTPPAYIKVANDFAPHMVQALKDEVYAQKVVVQLKNCVATRRESPTLQAYCLVNIKRLDDTFSSLSGSYEGALPMASPRARLLAKKMQD